MSIPQNVASMLEKRVVLEIESMDRIYLNEYIPLLQTPGGIVEFFHGHRGRPFTSSVLMGKMTRMFVAAIEQYAQKNTIPIVSFSHGQRKEDVAHQYLTKFSGTEIEK